MSIAVADRPLGVDGSLRVRDYRPIGQVDGALPLLWVHGGAFMFGGLDQAESDAPARWLAEHGRRVWTVDYRLLPLPTPSSPNWPAHHPNQAPAALADVRTAFRAMTAATAGRCHIGGASAGAALAAGSTLGCSRESRSVPASLTLFYGTYHAALPFDPDVEASLDERATPLFPAPTVELMNLNYVRDPRSLRAGPAFPGGACLTGLPPTALFDAEQDRLRASGARFSRELEQHGIPNRYEVIAGARHGFLDDPDSPTFGTAMRCFSDWLTERDREVSA